LSWNLTHKQTQVTSRKDQEQYWSDRQRPYHFVSVRDFREAYQQFSIGAQMKEELAVTFPKEKNHKAALTTEKYSASKMDLLKANYDKQWLLMKRNAVVYIFMILQVFNSFFLVFTFSLYNNVLYSQKLPTLLYYFFISPPPPTIIMTNS
jgi:hypothetical protein